METFSLCLYIILLFVINSLTFVSIIFATKYCPFLIVFLILIPPLSFQFLKWIKQKRSAKNYTENSDANHIFFISRLIGRPINSQSNSTQINQLTNNESSEPPPAYDMVTIDLPSYDDAVKSHGIVQIHR